MRTKTRRLSLDLIQGAAAAAASDRSADGIFRYMDLMRLPPGTPAADEVSEVRCECCGLSEDCTRAYVRVVRDRFCGRWVCGLCAEAVEEEEEQGRRLSRHLAIPVAAREEAVAAHMEVCRRYNRVVRRNPAMSLAGTMSEILKKSCQQKGYH